jgi:hypothetical protein
VIQATLQTDKGPIGIIGINRENWLRLQAGMPLDIDLKSLTPPGTRMNRIIIHYAHTYEDVVKDLEQGGFPIPESMYEAARRMDEVLTKEQ